MIKFKIKNPKKLNDKNIKTFFRKKGLTDLIQSSDKKGKKVNEMVLSKPYKPEIRDLYNLYSYIILNKRITVLEFGSGWSSLVIALALDELKKKYSKEVARLRRNNPFELFIVENEKKFLNITRKKLGNFVKKII